MLNTTRFLHALFYGLLLFSPLTYAGLHCPHGYITKGDSLAQVISTCGKPLTNKKLAANFRQYTFPKGKKLKIEYAFNTGDFVRELYFINKQLFLIEKGKRITHKG